MVDIAIDRLDPDHEKRLTSLVSKTLNSHDFVRYALEVREINLKISPHSAKKTLASNQDLILVIVSPCDYLSQHEAVLFFYRRLRARRAITPTSTLKHRARSET